jgi:hypothetical protein
MAASSVDTGINTGSKHGRHQMWGAMIESFPSQHKWRYQSCTSTSPGGNDPWGFTSLVPVLYPIPMPFKNQSWSAYSVTRRVCAEVHTRPTRVVTTSLAKKNSKTNKMGYNMGTLLLTTTLAASTLIVIFSEMFFKNLIVFFQLNEKFEGNLLNLQKYFNFFKMRI